MSLNHLIIKLRLSKGGRSWEKPNYSKFNLGTAQLIARFNLAWYFQKKYKRKINIYQIERGRDEVILKDEVVVGIFSFSPVKFNPSFYVRWQLNPLHPETWRMQGQLHLKHGAAGSSWKGNCKHQQSTIMLQCPEQPAACRTHFTCSGSPLGSQESSGLSLPLNGDRASASWHL